MAASRTRIAARRIAATRTARVRPASPGTVTVLTATLAMVLLAAGLVCAQVGRQAPVPVEVEIIGCIEPSDVCQRGTTVRLKVEKRDDELMVMRLRVLSNQLGTDQVLTELRRFPQRAMAPAALLERLVSPKPLRIRAVVRSDARTLMITLVEPATTDDFE